MGTPHDRGFINGSERSAPLRRRLRLPILAVTLVAASLTLAACGSSGSTTIATLNTEKVERAIAQSSLEQRGQHAQVSCPSDVPQVKGLEFSCTAKVGQVATKFVVVQQDGSGHVHYEAP